MIPTGGHRCGFATNDCTPWPWCPEQHLRPRPLDPECGTRPETLCGKALQNCRHTFAWFLRVQGPRPRCGALSVDADLQLGADRPLGTPRQQADLRRCCTYTTCEQPDSLTATHKFLRFLCKSTVILPSPFGHPPPTALHLSVKIGHSSTVVHHEIGLGPAFFATYLVCHAGFCVIDGEPSVFDQTS